MTVLLFRPGGGGLSFTAVQVLFVLVLGLAIVWFMRWRSER